MSTVFQLPLRFADWAVPVLVPTLYLSASPLWVMQEATSSTSPTSSLFPLSHRSLEVWQVRHYSRKCVCYYLSQINNQNHFLCNTTVYNHCLLLFIFFRRYSADSDRFWLQPEHHSYCWQCRVHFDLCH